MPIVFPKNGLNYAAQLQHLKSGGLIVHNDIEAHDTLMQISFYRLRGYYIQWYDRSAKKFTPGVTFENIVRLHQFDLELTGLILKITSHIEIALRSHIANEIADAGSAMDYMNMSLFDDPQQFMENQGKLANEVGRSKELFVEHNKTKYNGHVPIWAVMEVTSFGTLSKLFKSLDADIKKKITDKYYHQGSYYSWVETWLQAVTVLRNMCAHRARLYNRTTGARPIILNSDRGPSISPQTIYGAMLSMHYLSMHNHHCPDWKSELINLFAQFQPEVELQRLGFPSDWEQHF